MQLYMHPSGDIPDGMVERVEYDMGEHWPTRPMVRTNAADRFRLEISAFGTALCVAKVYFADGRTPPLLLHRYLSFG